MPKQHTKNAFEAAIMNLLTMACGYGKADPEYALGSFRCQQWDTLAGERGKRDVCG